MKKYFFGNGMVLEVGKNGFTFKNTITDILIIDASKIKKGGEIEINCEAVDDSEDFERRYNLLSQDNSGVKAPILKDVQAINKSRHQILLTLPKSAEN